MIDIYYDESHLEKSRINLKLEENLIELVSEYVAITKALINVAAIMYVPEEEQKRYCDMTIKTLGALLVAEGGTDFESFVEETDVIRGA